MTLFCQLSRRAAVCIGLTILLAGCGNGGSSSARPGSAVASSANAMQTAAVHDSIAAMLSDFTAKMNAKDMDAVGKYYSDDSSFFWVEGGLLQYRTAADVRAALLTLRNIPEIKLVYYETHIDVLAPTVATVRTEFSQTFMSGIGKGTTYGGYITMTVVREPDGWRLRNGHTSSLKPRPQ